MFSPPCFRTPSSSTFVPFIPFATRFACRSAKQCAEQQCTIARQGTIEHKKKEPPDLTCLDGDWQTISQFPPLVLLFVLLVHERVGSLFEVLPKTNVQVSICIQLCTEVCLYKAIKGKAKQLPPFFGIKKQANVRCEVEMFRLNIGGLPGIPARMFQKVVKCSKRTCRSCVRMLVF